MKKTKRRATGTHYTRLLSYLKQYGKITSLEAIRDLGNTRLSATIFSLRKDGYDIPSVDKSVPNRWGGTTTVSQYELVPTIIPKQQPNGNILYEKYYHEDEVNAPIQDMIDKLLKK